MFWGSGLEKLVWYIEPDGQTDATDLQVVVLGEVRHDHGKAEGRHRARQQPDQQRTTAISPHHTG